MQAQIESAKIQQRDTTWRPGRKFIWRDYDKAPRVYVNVNHGNDDVLNDLLSGRRHDRPEQLIAPLVRGVVQTYSPGATVRWSQKAGCSCGCSPAFIVKPLINAPSGLGALAHADLFLDVQVTA